MKTKVLNILILGMLIISTILKSEVKIPSRKIKNLKDIRKEFKNEPEKLNFYINLVKEYYDSGAYEKEVTKICNKSKKYFNNLLIQNSVKENDTIIFDVDETALSSYELYRSKNLIWGKYSDTDTYRQQAKCKAIKPILDLYNFLKNQGYKIIFITTRKADLYNGTYENLIKEGYTGFETLILLPIEVAANKNIKHEDWKIRARKVLSAKYNIIALISDSEKDFIGGYTGHKIKLPNYLY